MSHCHLHRLYSASHAPAAAADPYRQAHHALRNSLSALVVRLGCTEHHDASLLAELRRQLAACTERLRAAEATVHALLRDRAPEAVDELEIYHRHHEQGVAGLISLIDAVEQHRASRHALYLAFTRFVAAEFAHMAHEELETLPILQALLSEEELAALTPQPKRRAA